MLISLFLNAAELGLIYALVAIAVFFALRIARFDDFTIEGSFGLGGALTVFLLKKQFPLSVTMACVIIGGLMAGITTGLIHKYLKITPLICGLVVTTGLFSCNLILASSHASLTQLPTLFSSLHQIPSCILLAGIVGLLFTTLCWFLKTESGLLLIAAGDNKQFVTNLGRNPATLTIITLGFANGFSALAGSLFIQWSGFFSITGSVGTLVIGLTGLILGEMLLQQNHLGLLVGPFIYQLIFAFIIELNIAPAWNNLLKAIFIITLLIIQHLAQRESHART